MMKRLRGLFSPRNAIKNITYLSLFAFGWIIIIIVVDVSGRFFFNRPLPGAIEMSMVVMPWLVFPAMAYTLAKGGHIRMSLLLKRLPKRGQLWCEILACISGLALIVPVAYAGYNLFWESWIIRERLLAAIAIPWYIGKFIFPIGLTFFCVQFVIRLVQVVREMKRATIGETVQEKEFA